MMTRDRHLQSLVDLAGRSGGRSRPELVGHALRCALQLLDAAGAVVLLVQAKQAEGFSLLEGAEIPDSFTRPIQGADLTRVVRPGPPVLSADFGADPALGRSLGCPGLESGPALFVPVRTREQDPGYLAA